MREIVRGGGRDFKSVDLPRGFQIKEKVKVVKNIDIAILKCLQRFVIYSNSFIMYKELVLMIV